MITYTKKKERSQIKQYNVILQETRKKEETKPKVRGMKVNNKDSNRNQCNRDQKNYKKDQ